jgi:hypothetical protein
LLALSATAPVGAVVFAGLALRRPSRRTPSALCTGLLALVAEQGAPRAPLAGAEQAVLLGHDYLF